MVAPAACVIAAAACGCASSVWNSDWSPSPSSSGLDPLQPSVSAPPSVMVTLGVEVAREVAYTSLPWTLLAISDDPKTISVMYGGGSCDVHVGYRWDVVGDRMTLSEFALMQSGPCTSMFVMGVEAVPLTGSAQLIHADSPVKIPGW